MATHQEEQHKAAPGPLALVQALVNTQYGLTRRAHVELTSPEQLRVWLIEHDLLEEGIPVTEDDLRRVFLLREALRDLLRANNETAMPASQVEALNHLASSAPLTVRFHHDGQVTLEADIAGVDGALAQLLGIVFTAMKDDTWSRLKACRNERCQKAFYDTSRNRSGAWCSMTGCGSRLKASTYRQRRLANLEATRE